MATSASEEESITVLHVSSGPSENNTLTEPVSRVRDKHTSTQWRRCKFRGIGSSSVLLIIIWVFIISFSLSSTVNILYSPIPYDTGMKEIGAGCMFAVIVFLPISSLLAEVVISRYKLVRYSLRSMWFIYIIVCVFKITGYSLPTTSLTLLTSQLIVTFIPLATLLGAFIASAIPLAIDQIITGSNDNISAFIQWMVWSIIIGVQIPSVFNHIVHTCVLYQENEIHIPILSLVPVLLLSVGLLLDFFFGHKLVQEPVTVNPVTLIFKVLKYTAKHKYPVRRSAFTYCDDQQPSRLDYGKSKYGGPFTTEQVEDVKTFRRILLVLNVGSSLCVPLLASTHILLVHTNCINTIQSIITDSTSFIILGIPVYELLVYPCLRHRGPRILQSVGIGAAALIFSSLYGLTVETIQYYTSNGTTQCLFTPETTCFTTYIPFRAILGLVSLLLLKNSVEFICAQAPYNMRGLLIGIFLTLAIPFSILGGLLHIFWSMKVTVLDSSRYGIWFYLTTLVLGVVSSVLLVCVIQWYKARERDEIVNYQAMVEDIYYKYQQQEALQSY